MQNTNLKSQQNYNQHRVGHQNSTQNNSQQQQPKSQGKPLSAHLLTAFSHMVLLLHQSHKFLLSLVARADLKELEHRLSKLEALTPNLDKEAKNQNIQALFDKLRDVTSQQNSLVKDMASLDIKDDTKAGTYKINKIPIILK